MDWAVPGRDMPMDYRLGLLALMALSTAPSLAASLQVRVAGDGSPLADAVVSLHGVGDDPAGLATATASMDQRDMAFVPGVLPVQVGTRVVFPNSDQVRHQVYSFSEARRFELPLYAGTPAEPVVFDRAGVVVVGCNIHDWMIGHIVVLDTPHFAKSDASGMADIDAPAGRYLLRVWHPRLSGTPAERDVALDDRNAVLEVIELPLTPPPPPRQGSDRLRALQEKFRSQKPRP